MLDNLFPILGSAGTGAVLLMILGAIALPAISSVACPSGKLLRLQPRGR